MAPGAGHSPRHCVDFRPAIYPPDGQPPEAGPNTFPPSGRGVGMRRLYPQPSGRCATRGEALLRVAPAGKRAQGATVSKVQHSCVARRPEKGTGVSGGAPRRNPE